MISYAQNFEDVMLWRALKHVEKGFYVDVGANDPVIDSVTKAFYDAGWRGINIEPVAEWYEKLRADRPEDINIKTAVGDHKGRVDFFEVAGTGLSTTDGSIARSHASEHGFEVKGSSITVQTLTSILRRHPQPEIHFLKIDVEGAEAAALRGLDLEKIRPWIVLVESTLPMQQVESHGDWEPTLLDAGYEFVYFDGLNRFYVAGEHPELKESFNSPPNCFDGFVLSGTATSSFSNNEAARAAAAGLEDRITEIWERTQALDAELAAALAEVAGRDKLLHESGARAERLETELESARTEAGAREERLRSLESAIDEAEGRCKGLGEELSAARIEAGAREERLCSLESALKESGARAKRLETELESARIEAEAREERLRSLESALKESEARAEGLDAELSAARAEIIECNRKLAESGARAERLETELESARIEAGAREERLRSLETVHAESEARAEKLDAELLGVRAELVARDERLDTLETSLDDAEGRTDWLASELEAARIEISRYEARLSEEAASIESLNGELEALRRHGDELVRTNACLAGEVQRLSGDLDAARAWGEEHARASQHHSAVADIRHGQLQSIINSRSWRITLPLRQVMQMVRKGPVRSVKALGSLPASSTGRLLSSAKEFVDERPGVKMRIKHHLKEHPRLFDGLMHRVAVYRLAAEAIEPVPESIPPQQAPVQAPAAPAAAPEAVAVAPAPPRVNLYPKDVPSPVPAEAREPVRQYQAPAQGSSLASRIMEASGKWSLGRRLDD